MPRFLEAERATNSCIARCIKGVLEAERSTDICIARCIKGVLGSRWSVEMTGLGWFLNTTA